MVATNINHVSYAQLLYTSWVCAVLWLLPLLGASQEVTMFRFLDALFWAQDPRTIQ